MPIGAGQQDFLLNELMRMELPGVEVCQKRETQQYKQKQGMEQAGIPWEQQVQQ